MNPFLSELAGILIAVVLAADGLLHAYWATGRTWPAQSSLELVQIVLNISRTRSFRPRVLVTLASLLLCGALIVLARVHQLGPIGHLLPSAWLQLGILVLATGFLLRGLAGIAWASGLLASASQMSYKLNFLVFTPVCLLLFAAAVIVAFS